jgi:hypothetical protein
MSPAWRPTRGSGLGAVADVLTRGAVLPRDDDTPLLDIDDVLCEHADVNSSATAAKSDDRRERGTDAITESSRGAGRTAWLVAMPVITARSSAARRS